MELDRMNQVLRHRLRNFYTGMKFAIESIDDANDGRNARISNTCRAMMQETQHLYTLTERLDLLFGPLPEPRPMKVGDIVNQVQETFGRQYPYCELQLDLESPDHVLKEGSFAVVVVQELLNNAAEAIDPDSAGEARLVWGSDHPMDLAVIHVGEPWPEEIAFDPPIPFHTTRGKHEGLGLAIAYRYCEVLSARIEVLSPASDVVAVRIAKRRGTSDDKSTAADRGGQCTARSSNSGDTRG
jgi:C4-dicarboxylate-specific signal transduction histidine kinase